MKSTVSIVEYISKLKKELLNPKLSPLKREYLRDKIKMLLPAKGQATDN